MKMNIRKNLNKKGLTLIELIVAIFIFSLIAVAIVSVFVSIVTAYGKAKAIKLVKENAEFAISSIAKDVRMSRIESTIPKCKGNGVNLTSCLLITRNRGGTVCYYRSDATSLSLCDSSCANCSKVIDLSGTSMTFDTLTSGFYSCPTDTSETASPCLATVAEKGHGWVEINLNIVSVAGKEMEADQINVQTIVSSRDYGWEEVQ